MKNCKSVKFTIIISMMVTLLSAQDTKVDSLINALSYTIGDTAILVLNYEIANELKYTKPAKALAFLQDAVCMKSKGIAPVSVTKGHLFLLKGYILDHQGYTDEALEIIDKAITFFENSGKWEKEIYNSIKLRAYILSTTDNKELAIRELKVVLEAAKILKDSVSIVTIYNKIAGDFYGSGKLDSAAYYLFESIHIKEEKKDTEKEMLVGYNNIGVIYKTLGQYDKANKYFDKCLKILEIVDDLKTKSLVNLNLGDICFLQKDYSKAVNYLQDALKAAKESNFKSAIAKSSLSLGESLFYLEEYELSATYLKESTRIYKELGDHSGYVQSITAQGEMYFKTKKYGKAKQLAKEAVTVYQLINEEVKDLKLFQVLTSLTTKVGDYENAYKFGKLGWEKEKSSLDKDKQRTVLELQSTYEADIEYKAQTARISTLEEQKKYNQSKLIGSVLITFILLLFAIHLFLNNRSKNKTNIQLDEKQKSLEQTNKELNIAKQLAEELAHSKEEFLSVMSHEIRTPLNAVIGMSNILLDETPRPDQIPNLDVLSFSANNLLHIINNVLDFSKIEAGKMELEQIEFSIDKLLKDILNTFLLHKDIRTKDVDLHLEFEENELNHFLIGDPTKLTQILINLLGNAIKFTEKGGIYIKVAILKLDTEKATVSFGVKDTGIGIRKEKQTSIFENFTQADNTTSRKYGGTGLGLTITKKLIELLGGSIHLESEEGVGSLFSFVIDMPLGKELTEPDQRGSSTQMVLDGAHVLVAEDNQINQLVIRKILKKWNVEVDIAEDGVEAIQKVEEKEYGLILMDINMPNMDGIEASRRIRAMNGSKKNISIIALTASVSERMKKEAMECKIDAFVSKPFQPQELFDVMSSHLSKSSDRGKAQNKDLT